MKKLKIAILTLSILLLSVTAFSFNEVKVLDWQPFAYENITVTTAAVSQLSAAYIATTAVTGAIFLTVETNTIHYRIDGGDPTALLGHSIVATAYQNLWLNNVAAIRNLRMIAVGGNALVKVTYYRR